VAAFVTSMMAMRSETNPAAVIMIGVTQNIGFRQNEKSALP
jgi:hypothetical protein